MLGLRVLVPHALTNASVAKKQYPRALEAAKAIERWCLEQVDMCQKRYGASVPSLEVTGMANTTTHRKHAL